MENDLFIFVEENSSSNDVVSESRVDLVNRLNNFISDLMLDDDNYKPFLITDINDDTKIIKAINEFIGTFISVKVK